MRNVPQSFGRTRLAEQEITEITEAERPGSALLFRSRRRSCKGELTHTPKDNAGFLKNLCFLRFLLLVSACLFAWCAAAHPLDTWFWRNPSSNGPVINGVAYGKGTFVTVGNGGSVTTSSDGVTWLRGNSGVEDDLHAITFANSNFVAVGAGDTILISSNGLAWMSVSYPGTPSPLASITYGNGIFVTVGSSALTSPDGVNWTRSDQNLDPMRSVCFANG